MTVDLLSPDSPSPLQIEYYWSRLTIPGLAIQRHQCHDKPLQPPAPSLSASWSPSPTPFFKPPPPSLDGTILLASIEDQAIAGLTALFRLSLSLEHDGLLDSLGRAAFWERVADGSDWRPPSGWKMRAYEVAVLVIEVEFAREEYLREKEQENYDDDDENLYSGEERSDLEVLMDEHIRVWSEWERLRAAKGSRTINRARESA